MMLTVHVMLICMYMCVAPPIVGAWSMEVLLWKLLSIYCCIFFLNASAFQQESTPLQHDFLNVTTQRFGKFLQSCGHLFTLLHVYCIS